MVYGHHCPMNTPKGCQGTGLGAAIIPEPMAPSDLECPTRPLQPLRSLPDKGDSGLLKNVLSRTSQLLSLESLSFPGAVILLPCVTGEQMEPGSHLRNCPPVSN